jgi:hypothetical protein
LAGERALLVLSLYRGLSCPVVQAGAMCGRLDDEKHISIALWVPLWGACVLACVHKFHIADIDRFASSIPGTDLLTVPSTESTYLRY